jgi:hypothetical protein
VVNFDTELVDVTLSAAEKWRLRQRAGLVQRLLTGGLHLPRRDLERSLRLAPHSSGYRDLAGGEGAGAIGQVGLPGPAERCRSGRTGRSRKPTVADVGSLHRTGVFQQYPPN